MKKILITCFVIILLQGCAVPSGVKGELYSAVGASIVLQEMQVLLHNEKSWAAPRGYLVLPAGVYELEAIDKSHAYYKAPSYGLFLSQLGSVNERHESGESVTYEEFYEAIHKHRNQPWLFKPGCKAGGIKVPLEGKSRRYEQYYRWCPIETWDSAAAQLIAQSANAPGKNTVGGAALQGGVAAATIGASKFIIDDSLTGDLAAFYHFPPESLVYEQLKKLFPPFNYDVKPALGEKVEIR